MKYLNICPFYLIQMLWSRAQLFLTDPRMISLIQHFEADFLWKLSFNTSAHLYSLISLSFLPEEMLGPFATHSVPIVESDQTVLMHRLIFFVGLI